MNLFLTFGFDVGVKNNLTKNGFMKSCRSFSRKCNSGQYNMIIIVILAHGKENDRIVSVSGRPICYQDIYNFFDDNNCPRLKDKPKLFINQACRGFKKSNERGTNNNNNNNDCISSNLKFMSNTIVAHSTSPGN